MSKAPKYHNKKTTLNGIVFDSAGEAKRWSDLMMLQRAGKIMDLTRQFPIDLMSGTRLVGETRARPAIRLVVDYRYFDLKANELIYEDYKGMETRESRMKRHMAKVLRNIDVRLSP
jgi:hypothetical protein